MATSTSRITGAKELERVLRKLPGKLAERELISAARSGANVWRKAMKEAAPRGGEPSKASKERGPLHKNIRTTRFKKTKFSVEMAVHTGGAFWGTWFEFGKIGQAATHWASSAIDATAGAALERTGKTLGRRLEKLAKELAGPLSKISKGTRRRL